MKLLKSLNNKSILVLPVFGVAIFIVSFFLPNYTQHAYACETPSRLELTVTPSEAETKDAVLNFEFRITAVGCANQSELNNVTWYLKFSGATGNVDTPWIQVNGPNSPIQVPSSRWQKSKTVAGEYFIDDIEQWNPFANSPGQSSLKLYAGLSRINDNVLLGTSSAVTITLKGANPPGNTPGNTPPGNTPPANACTGPKCGTVSTPNYDTNVIPFINLSGFDTFPELVVFVMKGFFFLIGIMAVLIIIVGGVRLLLSQGNQESVTKGKQTIIWAVAGLIVALLSFSLVSIVQSLLSKPGP